MDINPDTITGNYIEEMGSFDEMWTPMGESRENWQPVLKNLQKIGISELGLRQKEISLLLKENGVTYSVYDDPKGLNRVWELDTVPLLIGEKDWKFIEAGLKQRAELLNFILKDIYGERKLIKEGLLPLDLIYNHSGFLRACDKIKFPTPHNLFIYAADIARGHDGKLWVLNDRTQAPSGAGYALENRSVMARALPDLFQDCHVRRMTGFFTTYHKSLLALAPQNKENPRIVILTPGPRNETYFEHAYMASYLGYTLVQGDDLTVRDGCVWLKTLGGLEPVDIIIRRVDDAFCDPLELREDSQLGVAGLLEVIRQGRVVVVNPLGSSILENPGLMAFLANICKYHFGSSLLLPSVATWWCGQPKEMEYVLDNFDNLVIKNIDKQNGIRSNMGWSHTESKRNELINDIRAKPHLFLGQERLKLSTTPAFSTDHIEPRNFIFRSFAVASANGYQAMPGGLTRSSTQKNNYLISNQRGGISKDTWIVGNEPEPVPFERPESFAAQDILKNIDTVPSRIGENMYWVGRYAERAISTARLLRTILKNYHQGTRFGYQSDMESLKRLLVSLTNLTGTHPGFMEDPLLENPESEILSVATEPERGGSLTYTLQNMFRSIYAVRERWSTDTWRIVDAIEEIYDELILKENISLRTVQGLLDHLITALMAFVGCISESTTREHGWLLSLIGRRIEQGLLLSSLIRSTLCNPRDEFVEYSLLEAVLLNNENLVTYRFRYRSYLQLPAVLDLLILDATNPRSLAYQVVNLQKHIKGLPKHTNDKYLSIEEKFIMDAYTKIRLPEIAHLMKVNDFDFRNNLETLLVDVCDLLYKTSDALTLTYFTHSNNTQQMYHSKLNTNL